MKFRVENEWDKKRSKNRTVKQKVTVSNSLTYMQQKFQKKGTRIEENIEVNEKIKATNIIMKVDFSPKIILIKKENEVHL